MLRRVSLLYRALCFGIVVWGIVQFVSRAILAGKIGYMSGLVFFAIFWTAAVRYFSFVESLGNVPKQKK